MKILVYGAGVIGSYLAHVPGARAYKWQTHCVTGCWRASWRKVAPCVKKSCHSSAKAVIQQRSEVT